MAFLELEWDDLPVTRPGLYKGLPIRRYHEADVCEAPSISSSGLRQIWNNPARYWLHSVYNRFGQVEDEEKAHFIIGRAMHHLAFGEKFFNEEFVFQPEGLPDRKSGIMKDWHGNRLECIAWKEMHRARGLSVLSHEEGLNIKGMATAIQGHELFKAGMLHGRIERSLLWKDKETGVWLRARPDVIPTDSEGSVDIADLKTTKSVTLRDVVTTTFNTMNYHMQAALIRTGFREVLGLEITEFALLYVEKTAPYSTAAIFLKPHDMDLGEKQNRAALKQFAASMKSGYWPGPNGQESLGYVEMSDNYRMLVEEKLQRLSEER